MKAWKVFCEENEKLYSYHKSTVQKMYHDFVIEYEYGKVNFPKEGTGGIFCFRTKKDAYKFMDNENGLVCLPVEIEVSDLIIIDVARGFYDIMYYWDCNLNRKNREYCSSSLPNGTVLAKSLVILEEE